MVRRVDRSFSRDTRGDIWVIFVVLIDVSRKPALLNTIIFLIHVLWCSIRLLVFDAFVNGLDILDHLLQRFGAIISALFDIRAHDHTLRVQWVLIIQLHCILEFAFSLLGNSFCYRSYRSVRYASHTTPVGNVFKRVVWVELWKQLGSHGLACVTEVELKLLNGQVHWAVEWIRDDYGVCAFPWGLASVEKLRCLVFLGFSFLLVKFGLYDIFGCYYLVNLYLRQRREFEELLLRPLLVIVVPRCLAISYLAFV